MKKLIMTAILATVFVAGMAFNATPASATRQDTEKCYEEVTIYGDIIEKETRTKTSSDFGRTWSDYSEWADWPDAGPVNDDGRNRGPAFHGEDDSGRYQWYRQYRYVVKGQFVKGTEMKEVPCPTVPTTTAPSETTVPPTTAPPTTQPPYFPPETTAPPTTQPPVTTTTVVISDSTTTTTQPPVVTTVPPTVPPSVPPTVPPPPPELPSTGSENWVMAAIGALAIMLGTGAVTLSRRKS